MKVAPSLLKKAHDAPAQLTIRPDWLDSRQEEIIDPALRIIDPHHHIWDRPGGRYLFDEFLADTQSGHVIESSVFIECHGMWRARGEEAMRPVGETEFAAGIAAQSDSGRYGITRMCAAIVGYADFNLGDAIESVLAAHDAAAGGRLRGVRGRTSSHDDPDINQWKTPPGVLLEGTTHRAITAIARRGLSLDVWVYQTQLGDVVELCRRFPELTVIVDHIGGPLGCGPYTGRRAELFGSWSEGVRAIAQMPNAVIKLSGLGMRFAGFGYGSLPIPPTSDELAGDWKPYVDTCIQAFGPARCMFASNFPADKGSYSYPVMWNAFKKLTAALSRDERETLFHGTARRVYRINPS